MPLLEMKTSQQGIELIQKWEGIEDGNPRTVNLDPYLCIAGVATIGWGHAITVNKVQLKGKSGLARAQALYPNGITRVEALELLQADVAIAEVSVRRLVHVPLAQHEFDALVSFEFNTGGLYNWKKKRPSTLLALVNAGSGKETIAAEFGKWIYATVNGKSQKVQGLINRRKDEARMFLGMIE